MLEKKERNSVEDDKMIINNKEIKNKSHVFASRDQ